MVSLSSTWEVSDLGELSLYACSEELLGEALAKRPGSGLEVLCPAVELGELHHLLPHPCPAHTSLALNTASPAARFPGVTSCYEPGPSSVPALWQGPLVHKRFWFCPGVGANLALSSPSCCHGCEQNIFTRIVVGFIMGPLSFPGGQKVSGQGQISPLKCF